MSEKKDFVKSIYPYARCVIDTGYKGEPLFFGIWIGVGYLYIGCISEDKSWEHAAEKLYAQTLKKFEE